MHGALVALPIVTLPVITVTSDALPVPVITLSIGTLTLAHA